MFYSLGDDPRTGVYRRNIAGYELRIIFTHDTEPYRRFAIRILRDGYTCIYNQRDMRIILGNKIIIELHVTNLLIDLYTIAYRGYLNYNNAHCYNVGAYYNNNITPNMFDECERIFMYARLVELENVTPLGEYEYVDNYAIQGDVKVNQSALGYHLSHTRDIGDISLIAYTRYDDGREKIITLYKQLFTTRVKRASNSLNC